MYVFTDLLLMTSGPTVYDIMKIVHFSRYFKKINKNRVSNILQINSVYRQIEPYIVFNH